MSDNFKEIMDFAFGCFPGLREWVKNAGKLTVQIWRDAFSDVDPEHAKAAMREMVNGSVEMPSYTAIPSVIRKRAREIAFQRSGVPDTQSGAVLREERFSCASCRDSGWVAVIAPKATAAESGPVLWTCNAACADCEKGIANSQKRWGTAKNLSRRAPPLVYDGKRMCKVEGWYSNEQRVAAYKEWHATYEPPSEEIVDEAYYEQRDMFRIEQEEF